MLEGRVAVEEPALHHPAEDEGVQHPLAQPVRERGEVVELARPRVADDLLDHPEQVLVGERAPVRGAGDVRPRDHLTRGGRDAERHVRAAAEQAVPEEERP